MKKKKKKIPHYFSCPAQNSFKSLEPIKHLTPKETN